MRSIITQALVLVAWTAPAGAATQSSPSIPVGVDDHGGVAVAVSLDDRPPVTFILDTGAARTIVADDLVRETGSRAVAVSDMVTSAGTDRRPVVHLASISVADARAEGLDALVISSDRLAGLGPRVRGVLGQDFLSAFSYTIDYRHRRLTWDTPLDCHAPEAVPLVASEGRFTMTIDGERGAPLRLVPDTGAEIAVLFRPAAPFGPTAGGATLTGLAGEQQAARLSARRLRIGATELHDVPAVLVDRTEPAFDGLMPLHGFSSVSFADGGRCLSVRP